MSEAPQIAEFASTDEMIAAFRACIHCRGIGYETLDHVCGFPKGYTSKLMSLSGKRLGPMSFDALTTALGVRFVMQHDAEAFERIAKRLTPRGPDGPKLIADRQQPIVIRLSRRRMKKLAKLAAEGRKRIPGWKRRAIARKAARARWRKRDGATLSTNRNGCTETACVEHQAAREHGHGAHTRTSTRSR